MMRVGVIGLGNMGEGMAMNLTTKGFDVVVRDVRPEPVSRLKALGARAAATNAALGQLTEAVMVAVYSQDQVADTLLPRDGDDGLIAGMQPGGVVCINSTISPEFVRELAAVGAERGVVVMDVAMSGGGDVAARAGALTFMVGGDAEAFERCRPALDAMATTVHHVGPLGSGVTAKIINNLLAIQNVATVREALQLSRALGFEDSAVLAIVQTAVGSSWVSNNWERIREQERGHTLGAGGIAAMAGKDLDLAIGLGRATGTPMPLLEFVVDTIVPDLKARGMTGDR
jgi:3-hydroxyisobutyrate dehydrogenase-like beta-hydroxyacid dehydrogenase